MSADAGESPLPANALCARHEDRPAAFLCARCGDFACEECGHRVHPTAQPLCAGCWSQRELAASELERGNRSFRLWMVAAGGAVLLLWLAFVAASFAGF